MTILETQNLTYVYGAKNADKTTAVDQVNLSIKAGEVIGVIGHTGSGKSTLIQQFNGLLRPTSGKVLLHGKDIWAEPKKIRRVRFQVGMVFQYPEYQLFEDTVEKDIAFGPRNQKLLENEVCSRVDDAIAFVGLDPALRKKSPFELSGGEKRRVAIAGVVAMDPEVLILDEPTAGLDPHGRTMLMDQIMAYHKKRKNTIILVSHSMEDVANYVERLIVMNRGEVMLDGTPRQVFAYYKELEAVGLAAPQVTYLMHELRRKGLGVDVDATTLMEAKASILQALKERKPKTPL